MGKPVSKNAQKSKETVFNVSNELKEAEVWRNKPGSGKEDPLQKEKQSYLDQMILASKDDNLKLIHIAERKLKNVNKADFNPYKPPKEFSQKLPAGSKDKRWAAIEKKKVEAAKDTFDSADLCTVRELEAMNNYVMSGGHKNISSAVVAEGSELKEALDYVLGMNIDLSTITDDYISNHAADMYEYVQKLNDIDSYVKSMPGNFASLREEEFLELQCRLKTRKSLEKYLVSHMQLHGVDLNKDVKKGKFGVSLRHEASDKKLDKNGKAAKKKLKNALKTGNQRDRDALVAGLQAQAGEKARLYTESKKYNSKEELAEIDALLNSNRELYKHYGAEIKKAYSEIKKILSLRDEELEIQRLNLKNYGKGTTSKEKKHLKELEKCNARLDVMTGGLSSYKEFLYCITGKSRSGMVSKK